MSHGLSDDALECFEEVVFSGNGAWKDSFTAQQALGRLSELRRIGGYDRVLLLAYVRMSRHSLGVERLERILDRFEQL
ncbi:hypothetical protein [Microbacterium sp. NPDC096154]|uniref:hypothetical protein n=1 Tax=Microbacterium sp. NPDC096154 TaxID=3155549 RepID=UPI003324D204